jgi:hypothetical protein
MTPTSNPFCFKYMIADVCPFEDKMKYIKSPSKSALKDLHRVSPLFTQGHGLYLKLGLFVTKPTSIQSLDLLLVVLPTNRSLAADYPIVYAHSNTNLRTSPQFESVAGHLPH